MIRNRWAFVVVVVVVVVAYFTLAFLFYYFLFLFLGVKDRLQKYLFTSSFPRAYE
jgi:hypothetical protein